MTLLAWEYNGSILHGWNAVARGDGAVAIGVEDCHLNWGNASTENAKLAGGTPGEVDDTATAKGPAVVDLHYYHTLIVGIVHPEEGAEGMTLVGTGETVVV